MKRFSKFIDGIQIGSGVVVATVLWFSAISYGAAAWGSLPNAGTTLSSAAWNDIVSQVNGLAGAIGVSSWRVSIGTASPDASAVLDVSSTSKGMLVPRMTKAQRDAIASPADGMVVYCSDCSPKGFKHRVNGAWSSNPIQETVLTSTNPIDAVYSGDGDCVDNETKIYMTPVTLTPWKWRVDSSGTGYKYAGIATAIGVEGSPAGMMFNVPVGPGGYFGMYKSETFRIGATTTYTPLLVPRTWCFQGSLDKVYDFKLTYTLIDE